MYVNFSMLSLFLFLGIGQAIFLAVVYFRSGLESGISERLMAGLLGVLAISMGNGFFYQTNLYEDLGWLIGLPFLFSFLIGPVFWIYVRSLTETDFRFKLKSVLHLGPPLVYLLLALPFLSAGGFYKMVLMYSWLHHERPIGEYLPNFWYELALPLQMGVYLVMVWIRLRTHERHLRDHYSTVDGLTLVWLRKVVAVFALGLIGLALGYFLIVFRVQLNEAQLCAPIADILVVYYLAWVTTKRGTARALWLVHGSRQTQPTVFPPVLPAPLLAKSTEAIETKIKYEKSTLPEDFAARILQRLEQAMQTQKPYLDPELTLDSLATLVRASRNHLSQVLNQNLKITFYEYVNRYRIRDASEKLTGPSEKKQDILTIAGNCGFHSKSTFNKVFKAWFGVSPSEYKRGLRCPPLSGVDGDKGIV